MNNDSPKRRPGRPRTRTAPQERVAINTARFEEIKSETTPDQRGHLLELALVVGIETAIATLGGLPTHRTG